MGTQLGAEVMQSAVFAHSLVVFRFGLGTRKVVADEHVRGVANGM